MHAARTSLVPARRALAGGAGGQPNGGRGEGIARDEHHHEPTAQHLQKFAHGPLDRVIWDALCSRYVDSAAAVRRLHLIATSDVFQIDLRRLAVSSIARFQVLREEHDEARTSIEAVAVGLEPWLRERWHAEVALESSDESIVSGAEATLRALAINPEVPGIHQGEIFFNLALLAERRKGLVAARAACQRALERHPVLEGTVQPILARLGAADRA